MDRGISGNGDQCRIRRAMQVGESRLGRLIFRLRRANCRQMWISPLWAPASADYPRRAACGNYNREKPRWCSKRIALARVPAATPAAWLWPNRLPESCPGSGTSSKDSAKFSASSKSTAILICPAPGSWVARILGKIRRSPGMIPELWAWFAEFREELSTPGN